MVRASLLLTLLVSASITACVSAAPAIIVETPVEAAAVEPLPPPRTPAEAQIFLSASIAALRAGEGAHAALFLDAILRSDHLTDRGRANLYWLLVDAHRARLARLGATHADVALVDALGGFLVAADVLEADADMALQQAEARAVLTATRLRIDPDLGQSPAAPIIVEDASDPAGVIAALRCGPRDEPYYERQVSSVGGLESRELVCAGDGTLRTLWFDVSLAR
ncbi:MAG: hypothetical protein HYS27_24760 [Deltaproteobacteria bacterium]|nr:hypothetical protein [Deltaproteobacteria bacterium]